MDTTIKGDTTMFIPCDSNTVYFKYDILPVLRSNCAISTCHDGASAEKGVILDSYENVILTADVEPFNIAESELYKVLVDTDPEERMPLAPRESLNQNQIALIAKWILQGAEDLNCDRDTVCNLNMVSFSQHILPVTETHCKGCHSGNAPQGSVLLTDYAGIKQVAEDGRLFGVVAGLQGFTQMPFNQDPLDQCTIDQIKAWVDAGSPEN